MTIMIHVPVCQLKAKLPWSKFLVLNSWFLAICFVFHWQILLSIGPNQELERFCDLLIKWISKFQKWGAYIKMMYTMQYTTQYVKDMHTGNFHMFYCGWSQQLYVVFTLHHLCPNHPPPPPPFGLVCTELGGKMQSNTRRLRQITAARSGRMSKETYI